MKYRAEIDGLRAIAVLPVILFHAGVTQLSGGYVGVDIFFVISGFLITGILSREIEGGNFSLLGFYERRARRILPALFVVLATTSVLGALILLPYELEFLGRSLIAVVFFVSNILFWQESSYFAASAEFNPLLHTWSLGVEEQYYILFPIFLWMVWRWRKKSVVPLIGLLTVLSFGLAEYLSTEMPSANFYLLPTRAWELLAGSLAALYLLHRPTLTGHLADAVGILGLAGILVSIFAYDAATRFPSAWTLVPVLGTVGILVSASPQTWVGKLLSYRPFVGIGLISYSAYLWHQPLFAFARILDTEQHPSTWEMLLLALLSLILAWLSWRFVEQPFRRKEAFTRKRIFSMSGIGGASFIALGTAAIFMHGWPQRFPENQREWISTGPSEYGEYVRSAYRSVNRSPLAADHPNLVIVGDSFSQDFYNILQSAEAFEGYAISAIYVPARCQIHFGLSEEIVEEHTAAEDFQLCSKRRLTQKHADTLKSADIVVLAARWQSWSAEYLKQTLTHLDLNAQVIVIGSKSFEKNRRALLAYSPDHLEIARKMPDTSVLQSTEILERSLEKDQFVNLVNIVCMEGCPLFTPEGDLLSYDGLHLTPEGVSYIGTLLFKEPPLSSFAKQSEKP